ncbi:MAG: CapA family protein [Oscillospiraceae bacterium]|nr:CapA family protein [Oscillospiraceae bacterium]
MEHEVETTAAERERRRKMREAMQRKREHQQKIALGIIALAAVLLIVLIARGCSGSRRRQEQTQSEKEAAQQAVRTEVLPVKVTLAAVGDIMCYGDQIDDAAQKDGSHDFSPSFTAISPYLQAADLTVGNLELNFVGPNEKYQGYPSFRAPESLAGTLANAGFDILQTANTYSVQNGLNGLNSTIRYLTENNIAHLGTYYLESEKKQDEGVLIRNISGIKFAFIGYTKGVNNMTLPEQAPYCVDLLYKDYSTTYSEVNEDALLASVKAAKNRHADVIVAMLHWGGEFDLQPTESQEAIADLLFQNGVDVILGSHSHEVGPMETRTVTVDGKEKKVLVAYSLGNFFSSMTKGTSQASCILNLDFSLDPETGACGLSGASYLPVYIADKGEDADLRYEVLPIRSAIQSGLFPDLTDEMEQAIDDLASQTGSSLDNGK